MKNSKKQNKKKGSGGKIAATIFILILFVGAIFLLISWLSPKKDAADTSNTGGTQGGSSSNDGFLGDLDGVIEGIGSIFDSLGGIFKKKDTGESDGADTGDANVEESAVKQTLA